MSLYLDASVLVALFVNDAFTDAADELLRRAETGVVVSDLAAGEFASAIARRARERRLTAEEARTAFSTFDEWRARVAGLAETMPVDIRAAEMLIRRLDLTLRTPDAIHIAIARRVGARLATFDVKMGVCAKALGVSVAAV